MECKNYSWSDLSVGLTESFSVNVTQEIQDAFTKLTGDINPMHIDSNFAIREGYRDKIVYGMLTASFYSTLVGVYLPGQKCLFHECDVQWPKPVYIGDTLTVVGKICEMDERFHRIKIKAHVVNQHNEKVSRASLSVGVVE